MSNKTMSMNRRDFLGLGAAGAAVVGALGLAGCAPSAPAEKSLGETGAATDAAAASAEGTAPPTFSALFVMLSVSSVAFSVLLTAFSMPFTALSVMPESGDSALLPKSDFVTPQPVSVPAASAAASSIAKFLFLKNNLF